MSFLWDMANLTRKLLILLAVAFVCPVLFAANEELKNLTGGRSSGTMLSLKETFIFPWEILKSLPTR